MPNWSRIQYPQLANKLKKCYWGTLITLVLNTSISLPVVFLAYYFIKVEFTLGLTLSSLLFSLIFSRLSRIVFPWNALYGSPLILSIVSVLMSILASDIDFFGWVGSRYREDLLRFIIPGTVIIQNACFLFVATRCLRKCHLVTLSSTLSSTGNDNPIITELLWRNNMVTQEQTLQRVIITAIQSGSIVAGLSETNRNSHDYIIDTLYSEPLPKYTPTEAAPAYEEPNIHTNSEDSIITNSSAEPSPSYELHVSNHDPLLNDPHQRTSLSS